MQIALYLSFAYLVGSISFAVVVSKLMGLSDPRKYGSGNPGATNVLRSGNKLAALLTLLGDCLKGVFVVLVFNYLARTTGMMSQNVVILGALAVFVGHLFPIFLKFKGGKGVATALGVLLALDPLLGLSVLAVWLSVALLTRYSSLAALVAAFCAPLFAVLPLFFSGGTSFDVNSTMMTQRAIGLFIMSLLLIAKHYKNIKQLLNGTESKIGAKK